MKSKFELELEVILKEKSDEIALLTHDVNLLKAKEDRLVKENQELKTQLDTLTSSSVTNSVEEVKCDEYSATNDFCLNDDRRDYVQVLMLLQLCLQ